LTEQVMLGVRRREGLPVSVLPAPAHAVLPQLATWGLVEPGYRSGHVVLTQRGRLLADAVVRELLTAA
jgi:oxygen-independent coproporphyrinogen-3 oxidase